MLSSRELVCSESCDGFPDDSFLGSLSTCGDVSYGSGTGTLRTIMSKSINFSVSVDISFSKQKAYSPT
jgi:hypothetical protein